MGLLEAAQKWAERVKTLASLPKICYAYPKIITFGRVMPRLKMMQKVYK